MMMNKAKAKAKVKAKAQTLMAIVALAAISQTPANHAFSTPIALAPPPSSAAPSVVGVRPRSSTVALRSQSSAAAPSAPEVKRNDNQTSITHDLTPSPSFLSRIFKRISGGDGSVIIRGDRYGSSNNSTILTPSDAAIAVGVKPTLEASKDTWKRAWKTHRFMMKVLHRFDGCKPKDSKLALACLWWKALAGNDPTSPVYDYQLSYDLLPPVTRWFVHRRICRWYPRLHHANVEIRTAYLDRSVSNVINAIVSDSAPNDTASLTSRKNIRLIVMGGGYDTRSIKLLERSLSAQDGKNATIQQQSSRRSRRWWNRIPRWQQKKETLTLSAFQNITSHNYDLECYELDLPEVVRAKRQLLQSRLFIRRPWLTESANYPKLIPVDFNDLKATRSALEGILLPDGTAVSGVHNIILFEGVMIYLDEGVPHSLMELCSSVLRECSHDGATSGHLCFADRLENIPGGDEDAANAEMEITGWELLDWLPKPGLARHMGVARLKSM